MLTGTSVVTSHETETETGDKLEMATLVAAAGISQPELPSPMAVAMAAALSGAGSELISGTVSDTPPIGESEILVDQPTEVPTTAAPEQSTVADVDYSVSHGVSIIDSIPSDNLIVGNQEVQTAEQLAQAVEQNDAVSSKQPKFKKNKPPKQPQAPKSPKVDDKPTYVDRVYNPDGVTQLGSPILNLELMFILRTFKGFKFNPVHNSSDLTIHEFQKIMKDLCKNDELLPESATSFYDYIGRQIQMFSLCRAAVIRSPAFFNSFRTVVSQAMRDWAYEKFEPEIREKVNAEAGQNLAETGDGEYDEFLRDVVNFNWEFEKTDSRMEYALCIQRLNALVKKASSHAEQGNPVYMTTLQYYATQHGVNTTTLLVGM